MHKHHLSSPLQCKLCISEDFYCLFKLMLSYTACIFSSTLHLLVETRKLSGEERGKKGEVDGRKPCMEDEGLKLREKDRGETSREILNNECHKQDTLHN